MDRCMILRGQACENAGLFERLCFSLPNSLPHKELALLLLLKYLGKNTSWRIFFEYWVLGIYNACG